MSTYIFKCTKCAEKFEEWYVTLQDKDPQPKCPKCQSISKRIIAAGYPPTIIFIDNINDKVFHTWDQKRIRAFGVHGDGVGSAEHDRLAAQKKKINEVKEKAYYNDKTVRNSEAMKEKIRKGVI